MEKRSLVYSLASPVPLDFNQHWQQIPYSIETVRRFSDIPVKVYVSQGLIHEATFKPNEMFSGVEVVEFQDCFDSIYPSYGCWDFAGKLDHKWKNAMDSLGRFGLDRVLFVDGDTFFTRSPHDLFNRYSDPTVIWTREENPNHITKMINGIVRISRFVNDGQFILPRSIANRIRHTFSQRQQKYIWEILKSTERILSDDDHRLMHWLSSQYSITKVLDYFGVGVRFFDRLDVSLAGEPMKRHRADGCPGVQSILHHYFFDGTYRYLPEKYWCQNWREHFVQKIDGRRVCSCGELVRT